VSGRQPESATPATQLCYPYHCLPKYIIFSTVVQNLVGCEIINYLTYPYIRPASTLPKIIPSDEITEKRALRQRFGASGVKIGKDRFSR
jgi:hypothetical protein